MASFCGMEAIWGVQIKCCSFCWKNLLWTRVALRPARTVWKILPKLGRFCRLTRGLSCFFQGCGFLLFLDVLLSLLFFLVISWLLWSLPIPLCLSVCVCVLCLSFVSFSLCVCFSRCSPLLSFLFCFVPVCLSQYLLLCLCFFEAKSTPPQIVSTGFSYSPLSFVISLAICVFLCYFCLFVCLIILVSFFLHQVHFFSFFLLAVSFS